MCRANFQKFNENVYDKQKTFFETFPVKSLTHIILADFGPVPVVIISCSGTTISYDETKFVFYFARVGTQVL